MNRLHLTSTCAIMLCVSTGAYAQTVSNTAPPVAEQPSEAGEIIVTARKRDERMIDTPASLSVFNANALVSAHVTDVAGIGNSVPSLHFQQRSSLQTTITIRGVGGDARSVGLESGVSVAIDGASVGRTNGYNTGLYDIAQIEVLRGPQGTLFGTNTIGGLINITTVKPTAETKAHASIDYGNYSSLRANGAISGALTDTLFASFNGAAWRGGAYIYNVTRDKKLQGHDQLGGRVALRWVPDGQLEVNVAGDWTRDNQDAILQQVITPYIGPAATNPPKDRFHVNMDQPTISNLRTWGFNGNANYDLGDAAITAVSSYRNTKTLIFSDGDSLPVNLVASGPFTDQSRLFTEELRIGSQGTHVFQYTAGLYYANQLAQAYRHIAFNGSYAAGVDSFARIRTESYAAFANADLKISDQLSLTGGIRYNIEDKNGSYVQIRPNFPALTFNFPDLHRKDKQLSWTAGAKYKITDRIASYVTVSQGNKSGGFNVDILGSAASTAQTIQFKPETLRNYEAGVKGEFFDRMLTLSASVFHMVYTDRQVSSYIAPQNALPFINITNAGKSRTNGFELEGTLNLQDELSINASISHLDGKYTSFPNATAAGASYTGHTTEFTPDWTATVNIDKTFRLASGNAIILHGDTHYQGNTYLDATQNRQNFQSGYWLLGARAGYEFDLGNDRSKVGVFLWGKNLTNKDYLFFARQASGANTGLYGDPRMYGLEVRFTY